MLQKPSKINPYGELRSVIKILLLVFIASSCSAPKPVSRITEKKGTKEQLQRDATGVLQLQQCPKAAKIYDTLWRPVISKHCISCHSPNGQAAFTQFKVNPIANNQDFAANLEVLGIVAELKTADGDPRLIAKPILKVPHGGGQILKPTSSEIAAIQDFIASPPTSDEIDCARNIASPTELSDPVLADRDMSATRLLRRASLAIRGTLPSLAEYAKIKSDATSYASMVDSMMEESEKSGAIHDRVHVNVFRRFLPGLVNEPVTLGNNMIGLGIEVRNKIRAVAKDSHAVNPEISRVWNKTYGVHNKDLEPATGCRKTSDDYLKGNSFEYYNDQKGPLIPDYSDCVFEAPMKTAAVEFKKVYQPGFSANFKPGHPYWNDRRQLAKYMTSSVGLIRSHANPAKEDVLGLGNWYLESGEVTSPKLTLRQLLSVEQDLPWKSLDLLSDATKWDGSSLPADFKSAYPQKIRTYHNEQQALTIRFDPFSQTRFQLESFSPYTTNSCGSISDGVRCSFIEREAAFMEMMRWIPPVDVYPDIYKPGYFSGCLTPGEKALLNSKPSGYTSSFWDFIKSGQARPPIDTALIPMSADALEAVPVNPWWDPTTTVYVCPGLAVQTAVNAGVIKQPPYFETNPSNQSSYYKILSRNQSLREIRYLKEDPTNPANDEVKSITLAEYALGLLHGANRLWLSQRGNDIDIFNAEVTRFNRVDSILQDCKYYADGNGPIKDANGNPVPLVFRSDDWQNCIWNMMTYGGYFWPKIFGPEQNPGPSVIHNFSDPNRKYRASVYPLDTIYNPLSDCGLNLRLCNPSRNGIAILASLEAHALFYDILKNKKPWRTILNADYRMTNRILEWARFYAEVEPVYILSAQASQSVKTKVFADFRSDYPLRMVAGDWNSPDIMAFLNGKISTPALEWFRFETSPEKLNQNRTLLNNFPNPDHDGVDNRYSVSDEGHQFKKEWLTYFAPSSHSGVGAPAVGVLSTSTFLNQVPRDRSRANKVLQFATCDGFPPAIGSFSAVESESQLPPRQRVKSGCAGCHNKGGVDPMARFFMSYAGSRAAEVDGNINFQGDAINWLYLATPVDPNKPRGWLSQSPIGLAGFGYVPEQTVMALNPGTYYGRNELGTAIDSWKGISVSQGLHGLSQVLLEEPKFTACTVKNAWRVALGRDPTSRESQQVAAIVSRLQKSGNYTFQDAVKEVVLSPAFRKDY